MSAPAQVPPSLHLLLVPEHTAAAATAPAQAARARLARWIGRADPADPVDALPRDWAARLCGMPQPPPWAAIWQRARHGSAAPASNVLLLSTVELVAGMNSVTLRLPEPAMRPDEQRRLATVLEPVFAPEGARLEQAAGGWLAWFAAPPEVRCTAPEAAVGRELRACLPEGAGAARLRRLLTECQMVLHQAAEHTQDWPARLNGIWAWGEGSWPEHAESTALLISRDPLLLALAATLNALALPPSSAPPDFDAATRALAQALADAPPSCDPVWHGSIAEPALAGLLAAAEAALRSGDLLRITLSWWPDAGPPVGWSLAQRSLWRLWRRPQHPWGGA